MLLPSSAESNGFHLCAGAQEFRKEFDDAVARNTELLGEDLEVSKANGESEEAATTTKAPSAADELASKTEKLKVDAEEKKD